MSKNEIENFRASLPDWMDDEKLMRVLAHYKDGIFEFDLPTDGFEETIRGVTYRTVPHYAAVGSEDILNKLRRIMARELDE